MTTITGHNIVIQQSGVAQEAAHHATAPKPSPEQTAAQQQANELVKNTTVQEFDETEKLKFKKEKDELRKRQQREQEKKKKMQEEMDLDPDTPGRLLDTTI